MIGADTSFLIDFFKGDAQAVSWMMENKDFLCINETVVYEFLCGNLNEKDMDVFISFVSQFPVFIFDRNASINSSRVYRVCKKKGKTISHPNSIIVGTYIANNIHKIITKNKKDFEKIEDITVVTY